MKRIKKGRCIHRLMTNLYNCICQLGDGYMLVFQDDTGGFTKVQTGYPYPVIDHEGGQIGKLRETFHLGNFNFNEVISQLNKIEYPADLYTVYKKVKEVAYSGIEADESSVMTDLNDVLREEAGFSGNPSLRVDYYLFLLELQKRDWRSFIAFISDTEFELYYPHIGEYLSILTRDYMEDLRKSVGYMCINPDGFVAVSEDTVRYDLRGFVPCDILDRFRKKLMRVCYYTEEGVWTFRDAVENQIMRCICGARSDEGRERYRGIWERFILGIFCKDSILLRTNTKNRLPIHKLIAYLAEIGGWRIGSKDAFNLIHHSVAYEVSLDIKDKALMEILNLRGLLNEYYLDFKYFFWDAIMRSDFIVSSDYDDYNNLFTGRDLHLSARRDKITIKYE